MYLKISQLAHLLFAKCHFPKVLIRDEMKSGFAFRVNSAKRIWLSVAAMIGDISTADRILSGDVLTMQAELDKWLDVRTQLVNIDLPALKALAETVPPQYHGKDKVQLLIGLVSTLKNLTIIHIS